MFDRPFALLRFKIWRPVRLLSRARNPNLRFRTRCVMLYVSRGPSRAALELKPLATGNDAVTWLVVDALGQASAERVEGVSANEEGRNREMGDVRAVKSVRLETCLRMQWAGDVRRVREVVLDREREGRALRRAVRSNAMIGKSFSVCA